jgi:hypothetical protein
MKPPSAGAQAFDEPSEAVATGPGVIRNRVHQLRIAGTEALRELRSGIGTAAAELRQSAAKAANRLEQGLRAEPPQKAAS